MKSSWAYKNGGRQLNEAINATNEPKFAWIGRNGQLLYAERSQDKRKLFVKTFANRKQAENKVKKLGENGLTCHVSEAWPFTIIKNETL
jgi:hypothetical protein